MEQQTLFEVANPCVQVCEMDEQGYCKGCLRNRTERDYWRKMTDEQKHQVMRLLYLRKIKQQRNTKKLVVETSVLNDNLTLFDTIEDNNIIK